MSMPVDFRPVDVICQFSSDGSIIPMRLRLVDEAGEYQTLNIKGFRDLSFGGARQMPDGVFISDKFRAFECNVVAFGRQRTLYLYFDTVHNIWKMNLKGVVR